MGYFRQNIEQAKGYIPGFQPQAMDVVKLNTNENPYLPSPGVMKVLSELQPEQLRRYPDPVGQTFREAAAQLHSVQPDWIMCCNGGDDLLSIAIRATCDALRPLAYPVPTYSLYPVLAKLHECPVVEVPFDPDFQLPVQLPSIGAGLTIVCNPNAPSATLVSSQILADLARALDGLLLIDEAYVDFADQHCADLVKDLDNVIILRSLSKGYSLAGMRFGYALAQPSIIKELMKVKDSYNVDAVSIAVATAAIQDQVTFKKNVEKIKTEREKLIHQLRTLGLQVNNSQANFILATCQHVSAVQIHEQLAQQNIFIRYFNLPGLIDKCRITVGTPQQNDRLIQALKEILQKG